MQRKCLICPKVHARAGLFCSDTCYDKAAARGEKVWRAAAAARVEVARIPTDQVGAAIGDAIEREYSA